MSSLARRLYQSLFLKKAPSSFEMKISTGSVERFPQHIAIIMDGNTRWAKARGLPVLAGHRKGAEVAREIVETAADIGVKYLTLYAFSSENWQRPEGEVQGLMTLLREFLQAELHNLLKNGVQLRVIGDRARLPEDIQQLVREAEHMTQQNQRLVLLMALSYGSRDEVVQACQHISQLVKDNKITPEEITESTINAYLYTQGIPDPDLLIRTSGEKRISNFLAWQMIYTELCFVNTLWPDFSKREFVHAIQEFSQRNRRFGKTSSDE